MTSTETVETVLHLLKGEYPQAGTRLRYKNRLQLLVAVILSARSTDEQVNQVTERLFAKVKSVEDLAEMEISTLEEMVRGCGLHRQKARNLVAAAKMISREFGGEVPCDFRRLMRLPGVGRKSANVLISVGFNKPGLGVDTHVFRVSGRLGWHRARTPERAEAELKNLVPENWWTEAHHLLIAHGRGVCRARKPDCSRCVVRSYCAFRASVESNATEDGQGESSTQSQPA